MAGIGPPPADDSHGNGAHLLGPATDDIPQEHADSVWDFGVGPSDLDDLWVAISNSENIKKFPRVEDLKEKIPSLMDLIKDTGDSSDVTDLIRRNVPNLGDFRREIPGLSDLGKDIPGLSDLGKDISGLSDLGKEIPGLVDLRSKLSYFSSLGKNSQPSKELNRFPSLGDQEKAKPAFNVRGKDAFEFGMSPDLAKFGQDISDLASFENSDVAGISDLKEKISYLNDIRQGISSWDDLSMNISDISDVDLDHIKDGIEKVGDTVESLTGMSPTDLISRIPGADIFGLGLDQEDGSSDDGSNDFLSVFSDIRSIGGDVAEIISDSKEFFTQLGALVGVFGTLINTGSNVIDDYHNGKMASGIFNMILLVSVQIPTISAMLFVFLKDKIHLSLKGFRKVKEDLQELVDDLESLIDTDDDDDDDEEDKQDPDSTTELLQDTADKFERPNEYMPVTDIAPDKSKQTDICCTQKMTQASDDERRGDQTEWVTCPMGEDKDITDISKSLKRRKEYSNPMGFAGKGDNKENTDTTKLSKKRKSDSADNQTDVLEQENKEEIKPPSRQSKKRKSKIGRRKHGSNKPMEQKHLVEKISKGNMNSNVVVRSLTSESSSNNSPDNVTFTDTSKSGIQISQKTLQSYKDISKICEEENYSTPVQNPTKLAHTTAGHTQKFSKPPASRQNFASLKNQGRDGGSTRPGGKDAAMLTKKGLEGTGVKLKMKQVRPDKKALDRKLMPPVTGELEASWMIVSHRKKPKTAISHILPPPYSRKTEGLSNFDMKS